MALIDSEANIVSNRPPQAQMEAQIRTLGTLASKLSSGALRTKSVHRRHGANRCLVHFLDVLHDDLPLFARPRHSKVVEVCVAHGYIVIVVGGIRIVVFSITFILIFDRSSLGWELFCVYLESLNEFDILAVSLNAVNLAKLDELVPFEGVQCGRVEEYLCCRSHVVTA